MNKNQEAKDNILLWSWVDQLWGARLIHSFFFGNSPPRYITLFAKGVDHGLHGIAASLSSHSCPNL